MSKNKLFLNSNDIQDITGQSLRTARNIMEWIRTEKGLSKRQVISIYDFCECFNFPLDVVFIYINSKEFKLLPLDESAIRKEQEQGRLNVFNSSGKLYTKDFEFLIEKKRQVAATKGEDTSERKEQAG